MVHVQGMEEEESLAKDSFDDSFDDSLQQEEEKDQDYDSDNTEEAFNKAAEYYKNEKAESSSSEESDNELEQDFIGVQ